MIPLYDENPTVRTPYVTVGLIALNVLVFLWEISGGGAETEIRLFRYGAVPCNVTQEGRAVLRLAPPRPGCVALPADRAPGPYDVTQPIPSWLTLLTSMFLHGGWLHLIGNLWFLWVFGNNIEDAMGPVRFVVFYLLAGLVAAGAHVASDAASPIPTIGASGAISGVLGAYVLLYPRARVLSLVPLGYFLTTFRLPALVFLGIWFLLQVTNVLGGGGGGVAWYAHVGGFVAGVALVKLFESGEHRRRGPPDAFRAAPRFATGRRGSPRGW